MKALAVLIVAVAMTVAAVLTDGALSSWLGLMLLPAVASCALLLVLCED